MKKMICVLGVKSVNEITNNILYFFFYLFPVIILILAVKLEPNFDFFPLPIRVADLLTPYLLVSVTIQSKMANLEAIHLYFYMILNIFGIAYASYLAFGKRRLVLGQFFRTWWRYTFLFSFIYHLIVGGYGIYLRFI